MFVPVLVADATLANFVNDVLGGCVAAAGFMFVLDLHLQKDCMFLLSCLSLLFLCLCCSPFLFRILFDVFAIVVFTANGDNDVYGDGGVVGVFSLLHVPMI